jgi:hypothetical protein
MPLLEPHSPSASRCATASRPRAACVQPHRERSRRRLPTPLGVLPRVPASRRSTATGRVRKATFPVAALAWKDAAAVRKRLPAGPPTGHGRAGRVRSTGWKRHHRRPQVFGIQGCRSGRTRMPCLPSLPRHALEETACRDRPARRCCKRRRALSTIDGSECWKGPPCGRLPSSRACAFLAKRSYPGKQSSARVTGCGDRRRASRLPVVENLGDW